jgi:hypothetical protein
VSPPPRIPRNLIASQSEADPRLSDASLLLGSHAAPRPRTQASSSCPRIWLEVGRGGGAGAQLGLSCGEESVADTPGQPQLPTSLTFPSLLYPHAAPWPSCVTAVWPGGLPPRAQVLIQALSGAHKGVRSTIGLLSSHRCNHITAQGGEHPCLDLDSRRQGSSLGSNY